MILIEDRAHWESASIRFFRERAEAESQPQLPAVRAVERRELTLGIIEGLQAPAPEFLGFVMSRPELLVLSEGQEPDAPRLTEASDCPSLPAIAAWQPAVAIVLWESPVPSDYTDAVEIALTARRVLVVETDHTGCAAWMQVLQPIAAVVICQAARS